jgi:hypothetical protein
MLPTTIFVAGALGLAVAILGGGITVKEITIPQVNWLARAISGCAGCVFILLALWYGLFNQVTAKEDSNDARAPVAVTQVRFILKASLGKAEDVEEIATELNVYLGDRKVARFSLDSDKPIDSVEVSVPERGSYEYSITGTSKWTANPDKLIVLTGKGSIVVDSGASYVVAVPTPSPGMHTWKPYLRREE